MTQRNTLAILGLRFFLEQNPEKLEQRQWVIAPEAEFARDHKDMKFTCGTVACVAGWTSLLSGDRVRQGDAEMLLGPEFEHRFRVGSVTTPDGRIMHVGDRAMEVLGLSERVATALFHTNNEGFVLREALRRLADDADDDEVFEFLVRHNSNIIMSPQHLG